MTLKPGADGELPVGAFMGEGPWQSQPMGAARALFRSDWIGTEALFPYFDAFSHVNRYPPGSSPGQAFAGKRSGWAQIAIIRDP
jgi:hypothetical protein